MQLRQHKGGVRCPTGRAVLTTAGGELKTKYVIHVVGPNYNDSKPAVKDKDQLLGSAYGETMTVANQGVKEEGVAQRVRLTSVALPLLSSGISRGEGVKDRGNFTKNQRISGCSGFNKVIRGWTETEMDNENEQ